jgi:hypothetical protein
MQSIAALPVIPLWSLAGVPPAEEMPKPIARRRYASSLAAALAGERCYEIKVWQEKKLPLLLQLRALQEDWPMIGTTAQTTSIMHPLPLPEDPAELFERAVAAVPEAEQPAVRDVLVALWLPMRRIRGTSSGLRLRWARAPEGPSKVGYCLGVVAHCKPGNWWNSAIWRPRGI